MIRKFLFTLSLILLSVKGFAEVNIEDLFSSSPEQIVTLTESRDFLIGGIVHPLSGQPCLHVTDLVAKGAQSISLKRTFIPYYTPLNEHKGKIHPIKKSYGGWVLFPHTHLNVFKKGKDKHGHFIVSETIVSVADPYGAVLAYEIDKNGNTTLRSKSFGICNGTDDHPSGMYDPRNTSISVVNKDVTLQAPDGTKRYYHSSHTYNLTYGKDHYVCLYCVLVKEVLPNGKVLRYTYNNERQIKKIESLDPSETHVYATLMIEAPLKGTEAIYTTNTDLQATFEHDSAVYFKKDKHEHYVDLLYPLRFNKSSSPFFRNEVAQHERNLQGDSVLTKYFGRDKIFQCSYPFDVFYKGLKKPLMIRELLLPDAAGFSTVYTMDYIAGVPGEKSSTTTVTHCDEIKTVYTFNPKMLPEKVSEYDQKGKLIKEKTFTWHPNQWLESIIITDGRQQRLSEKKFLYDVFGNPSYEILTGDLTGCGQQTSNEIWRTFSSDRRNLLLREQHSNGKVLSYTYLPETNLLTSRLIKEHGLYCVSREFRHYDNFHNLVEVITDDGSTDFIDNLTDVTERKITRYHLRQQPPFLHMPEQIETKYLENGVEKPLKKTILAYDSWGNVKQEDVYDSGGNFAYTILREYDEQGNLLSETNPLKQKAIYTYNAHGKEKTSWNFSNTLYTINEYDAKGRLFHTQEITTDGIERNFLFEYDLKDRLKKRTNSYNHSTTYTYDLVANQPTEIRLPTVFSNGKPLAVTEKTTYDALGRKDLSVDPNSNQTSYRHNTYGSPATIVYPDQSQEIFRYESNGMLSIQTFKNGLSIDFKHDILGNVIRKIYFFEGKRFGQETFVYKGSKLVKSYDLEGFLTEYTYDGAGRKISEEKDKSLTSYQYDSLGNLATIREENGENTLYTHFKRDFLGQILEKEKTDANGSILTKIAYSYDGNGNIKTIERKINGQDAIESFTYDAYNRETSYQDAQGYLTTTHYDEKALNPFGQQVLKKTTENPKKITTVETSDPYGRMAKQETINANSQIISSKEIDYDACGDQVLHQDHVYQGTHYLTTQSVIWTYDPCHRVKSMVRGTEDKRETTWTYHPSGKVFTKTQPDGMVLSYTYDAQNNLKSINSSDEKLSLSFVYNRLGHLVEASDEISNLKIIREVDPHGNILIEKFSTGLQVKKTYDRCHRPLTLSLPGGGEVVYHYDPLFLRKVERRSPSGKTLYEHTYDSYDESGYLLTESLPADLGCIHHSTDTKGQALSLSSDYFKQECQYDPLGNMTSQTINGANLTFDYDDLSQLISEPAHTYVYDSLYNRIQENENQVQYNALNEDSSCIYDLRGNLTEKSDLILRSDPLDRLVNAEIDDKKITYCYDPLGRKLSKTVNDTKEDFFYDGKNEAGTVSGSQLKILGLGNHPENRNVIAIELEGKAYAPILDIQGNVRSLIDIEAKKSTASYNYTAFGKQFSSPNPVFNPWQFASKRFDPDLGLIDFGKRYYDPQVGRWLSTDPAGFVDSYNLHQFNLNNPFRYCDPNGEFIFIPLFCVVVGTGAAGATVVALEITAAHLIVGSVVTGAAIWGIGEGLKKIDHAINERRFAPYRAGTTTEEEVEEKKPRITGEHTPDQRALSDLVKGRLKGGVSDTDADTLLDWADEYDFPSRDDRGKPHWTEEGKEHIHIGPGHLPVFSVMIL
jgi:RHS repeat-associated protein